MRILIKKLSCLTPVEAGAKSLHHTRRRAERATNYQLLAANDASSLLIPDNYTGRVINPGSDNDASVLHSLRLSTLRSEPNSCRGGSPASCLSYQRQYLRRARRLRCYYACALRSTLTLGCEDLKD